jgi:hypothetical protein
MGGSTLLRFFALMRCGLWIKIDLRQLLSFFGTAGGHFRLLAAPQEAFFPGFNADGCGIAPRQSPNIQRENYYPIMKVKLA